VLILNVRVEASDIQREEGDRSDAVITNERSGRGDSDSKVSEECVQCFTKLERD